MGAHQQKGTTMAAPGYTFTTHDLIEAIRQARTFHARSMATGHLSPADVSQRDYAMLDVLSNIAESVCPDSREACDFVTDAMVELRA